MGMRVTYILGKESRGFTLIELIVATAILTILTGLAIPLMRVTIKRQREHDLRRDLWEMRDAIDRYKDVSDRGAFQIKVGSQGLSPRFGYAGEWRGRAREENEISAPNTDRPHDGQTRMGNALSPG